MTTTAHKKILEFMARPDIGFELPTKLVGTKAGAARLWEELHYLLPRQLDELTDQLSGHVKVSPTKEKALARLEPWFAQAAGGLYVSSKQSNPTPARASKESTMSKFATPEVKKDAPAAEAPSKHAKKKAAVKAKVTAKLAKKQAKAKPAAKPAAKAGGTRGQREGTIASVIIAGLKAKKDPEKIVAEVKKQFPRSKSTTRDVAWYRWKLGQK